MSSARMFSSDELLKILALTATPTAIHTTEEMIIQTANDAMLNVWGKDKSVIGKPLLEALPELVGQPFMDLFVTVWRTGITYQNVDTPANLEINGQLKTFYFDFEYRALKNEAGEVYAILHTATDVTERYLSKQALEKAMEQEETLQREQALNEELAAANDELNATNEELQQTQNSLQMLNLELEERVNQRTKALFESEKKFRFMLNAIPQQVWTSKPDGNLDYVNLVVCNDFGYTTEEIVGLGWQKFIHPDDLASCLQKWSTSLITGNDYMTEFRLLFSDGSYRWHLSRAVALIEEGKIRLWLGTNTDIEFQKNNEQKKDEFLSIASHELKTPLTSIKAFNQLMQRTDDPLRMINYAKKSAEHVLRLERLINDLLDVTKINAGKMNYNMEPFSFKQMLIGSIESVQHTSNNHQIILEKVTDVTFNGDYFRLEQVVHNFLTNAIKYSPKANKVVVNSYIEQQSIIVSVQDFGIGIEPHNLDLLFDRYYRVDNTAMRFEGLGLGLFISSEILKGHHGSFWIESQPGEGSTFFFRLPLPDAAEVKPVKNTSTFYQDSSITIIYNEQARRLDVDWTGYQNMETVQRGGMLMLDMLGKNKCHKVLNDNTHVLGTWSEASDWAGNEWFPMMEKAGLQYFAWVFSLSAFSQLSAKKSVDIAAGNVITQFFTEIALADQWLNGLPD